MPGADSSGWLTFAATALSALGATLNGLHSLYGLSSQVEHLGYIAETAPAVAGGLLSGAATVAGGWFTAAKVSTAGVGFTTVGLSIGCVYASLGFLCLIRTIMELGRKWPPLHAPAEGSNEEKRYPSPEWLNTRILNWGVIGPVGAGKSTLINTLRGLRARDPEAAPVGVGHTTRHPHPYNFTGDLAALTRNMARLWDLPGAGTKGWPVGTYIRDVGLRHFDGVVFVTSGVFSETEVELMGQLLQFRVPYYVVRNKVDQDTVNNLQDNDIGVEETLTEIRNELREHGCDPARTFLISAKQPECGDFDFGQLLHRMATDASTQRLELPEFHNEALVQLPRRAVSAPRPLSLAMDARREEEDNLHLLVREMPRQRWRGNARTHTRSPSAFPPGTPPSSLHKRIPLSA